MSEPVHIAAIDAGSNAVRLSVARAYSALDIEPLHTERYSLRLGESVFLRHRFSEDIFKKGVKAFRHFERSDGGIWRDTLSRGSHQRLSRGAQSQGLPARIKQKSGIALEVISSAEESRLGREAALAALGPEAPPRCIIDLGGGSLEISILRDHFVEQSAQLPVGTRAADDHAEHSGRDSALRRPSRFAATSARCWNRGCLRARIWARAWRWRSAAMRKRWPPSHPGRASTACPRCSSLCCASVCRTFWNAMCASA